MGKYAGKTVLITGASSGIGKEVAYTFAKKNVKKIILVSRSPLKLHEIYSDLKNICDIHIYPCDISNKELVVKMKNEIEEKNDQIDILINNAGFGIFGGVNEQSIEEIESIMATNYFGMVYCIKNFLPSMIKNKSGHIINIASLAASFGIPMMASYCASKFAMLGFSESLFYELKGTGVKITVISPIAVRTNFFNNPSFNNKFSHKFGYVLDAKKVANAVANSINSSRFEITVPFFARGAVWLKHTMPFVVNPIIDRSFKRYLK